MTRPVSMSAVRATFTLALLVVLWAAAPRQASAQAGVVVALQSASASAAAKYTWTITKTSALSGPLSVAAGQSGSVPFTVAAIRTAGAPATTITGAVMVANGGSAAVTVMSVMVDALETGSDSAAAPRVTSQAADCAAAGASSLEAGASFSCSFSMTAPQADRHTLTARAVLAGPSGSEASGSQVFSSETGVAESGSAPAIGECAALTDTFASPLATSPDGKLPDLGSGMTVCGPSHTTNYTLTLGPYDATSCGTLQVTSFARASPTTGDQLPLMAPSTVEVMAACSGAAPTGGSSPALGGSPLPIASPAPPDSSPQPGSSPASPYPDWVLSLRPSASPEPSSPETSPSPSPSPSNSTDGNAEYDPYADYGQQASAPRRLLAAARMPPLPPDEPEPIAAAGSGFQEQQQRRRLLADPTVALGPINVASLTSYLWGVSKSVEPYVLRLQYSGTARVMYSVKYTRTAKQGAFELTGTVTVRNGGSGQLRLAKVGVDALWGFSQRASAVAACPGANPDGDVSLAPGASLTCSYSLTVPGTSAGGSVTGYAISDGPGGARFASAAKGFQSAGAASVVTGICALASDGFALPPKDGLGEGKLVAGAKPPADPAGLVLCSPKTFTYTMSFGNYEASNCGRYSVLSTARANPLNGTQPLVAANSILTLAVGGCGAPPESEETDLGEVLSVAKLVRPAAELNIMASGPGSSLFTWSVAPAALAPAVLPYNSSRNASWAVTFTRSPTAGAAGFLSGSVSMFNPNLISELPITRVMVEVPRSGGGPSYAAVASCPRNAQGIMRVPSVLSAPMDGSVLKACEFFLELGPDALSQVLATALTADGREVSSGLQPFTLGTDEPPTSSSGACAAISNSFVKSSDSALVPSSAGSGDAAANGTMICETQTVLYSYFFGPYTKDECGAFQATSVVAVNPISSGQAPVLATVQVPLQVRGCVAAPLEVVLDQVLAQEVSSFNWTVQASAEPSTWTMQFSDDRTVKYAVSYTKTATALSSQVEGQVVLSNTGTASTWLAKVQVELTQGAGDPRAVLADCPLNSLGKLAVPAASGGAPGKLTCTFRVSGLNATGGQLRAYAALATEEVKASSSMQLDPSTSAKVTSGYCALVGESYQPGAGYLDALVSSRSAAEAKQQTICESQDVNFEDTFGPFNDSQCGSLKAVLIARAEPTSGTQDPQTASAAMSITLNGCPSN